MEGSGDSFEYLLQLMKTLSAQSWSTRQQTEKVEQTLKRLAKQNQISFTENCKPPDEEAIKSLEELGGQTEEDLLVDENYRLMYQIQQQEYIHSKICLLIQQVNEMIASIKNFVVEQKNITPGLEHDFLQRNVNMPATTLSDSEHTLSKGHEVAQDKLQIVIDELKHLCKTIPWNKLPKDDPDFKRLQNQIKQFEETYSLQLISDSFFS